MMSFLLPLARKFNPIDLYEYRGHFFALETKVLYPFLSWFVCGWCGAAAVGSCHGLWPCLILPCPVYIWAETSDQGSPEYKHVTQLQN